MSIIASDIQKRYSVAAAAGDTTAGTAATSLGDQVSTTQIADDTFGATFPDVTSAEATAGVVKYRCVFALNNHATLTLVSAVATLASQTAGGAAIAIGVDTTAVSAKNSGSQQALTIANENTAPAGVSFGTGPVSLGSLAPSQVRAIWLRQTVTAGATPPAPDGTDAFQIDITGDTLP